MSNTHITLQEQKILDAVPSFPGDRNKLPKEIILAAAKDFCEQFRRSVQAFNESNRDERFKPCMSQHKYADDIYRMIEVHLPRPLYHDKDNFYQVLFVVSCLMGVADHRRSWWEETFAQSTAEYLDNTNNFHGAKQQIQAVIREIDSMLQYELNFDFPDDDRQTEQQTQKLQQQAEDIDNDLLQWMNQAQAEEQQRAQQPKAKRQLPYVMRRRAVNIYVNNGAQLNLLGDLNIDNVEHIDTINTYRNSPQPQDQAQQEPDRNKRAVLAVHQQCSCNAADWAVVVKLMEEQGVLPKSAYEYSATYINEICGEEVTSSKSLSRSIIYTKVIGKYPNWRIKDEEVSRETPKKLHRFMEIAKVFIDSQND